MSSCLEQVTKCCFEGLSKLTKKSAQGTIKKPTKANETPGSTTKQDANSVHMLIVALDYPGTGHELTCTVDGKNMKELASLCGVNDLTLLTNNDGNKELVGKTLRSIASRCQPGDFFIFNYSGHGTQVKDKDGDEKDGQDEALCLVTPNGSIDWNAFMTDDEMCEILTSTLPAGVNVILLSDCCHSGTIGDFQKPSWANYPAISLSGCTDNQTSGDTGRGGIFTHSLLMAVADKQKQGVETYSVAEIYNALLGFDDSVFNSKQDITMKHTLTTKPENMAWPLVPGASETYTAPWDR